MPYIGYAFILLVCLEVTLVCFGEVKEKVYPFLLYGIGAGMLLMTSLAGPYLIGSDIHLEYYYAQLRAGKDVLQPNVGIPQGTSITTYITDNIWAYKVLYPLLFALVPIILYFVYAKWVSPPRAFLASFFFIAFPSFFMELPGIPRQMLAELALAFLLLGLVFKSKAFLVVLASILIPLIHYAVALTVLILSFPSLLFSKRRLIMLALGAIVVTGALYFPLSERGAVLIKLAHIWNSWTPQSLTIKAPEIAKPQFTKPEFAEHPLEVIPSAGLPLPYRYEGLVRSGLGFDFEQTTIPGKVFRVWQGLLALLAMLGIWTLRRSRPYRPYLFGGLLLLVLLAIPGFSNLLNITRFVHLALFVLAPLAIVSLGPKYFALILIPYFLFTSGLVFEATKQPNIEKVTIPYNVGLSNYRIDLGASVTGDDSKVREYIYNNKLFPIFADIVGTDFMGEVVGWRDDLHIALRRENSPDFAEAYGSKYMRLKDVYVFVRSRNVKEGYFVVWNGIGLRKYVTPDKYGIDWNKNIIYQSGDARVIKVEEVK